MIQKDGHNSCVVLRMKTVTVVFTLSGCWLSEVLRHSDYSVQGAGLEQSLQQARSSCLLSKCNAHHLVCARTVELVSVHWLFCVGMCVPPVINVTLALSGFVVLC